MDRKLREPLELKLKRNFQTSDLESLTNEFNNNFINQIRDIKNKNSGPNLDVEINNYQLHSVTSTMYLRKAREKDIHEIL